MPNEDAENKDLDKPNQPDSGEVRGSDSDISADAVNEGDELIVPSGDVSQQEAAALIRDAAGQLNDFLADRRRESEELARRMTRIEEEIQNNGNAGRHLTALSVIVAIIAFLATTGLWRLARHQSDVQSALQQTMTEVKASRDASMEAIGAGLGTVKEAVSGGIKGLEEELSGQREAASRLEQQLGETSQRVAGVKEHVTEQLKQQTERSKSERAKVVSEVKAAIGGLEDSLEERSRALAKQSEELKSQQKEFTEATAKAKAERQAMIRAATETVNAQLLGLRTMLDTLEEEPLVTEPGKDVAVKTDNVRKKPGPKKPDLKKPDLEKSDLEKPDLEKPDLEKPDADNKKVSSLRKSKQPQKPTSGKGSERKSGTENPAGGEVGEKNTKKEPVKKNSTGKGSAEEKTDKTKSGKANSEKASSVAEPAGAEKTEPADAAKPNPKASTS